MSTPGDEESRIERPRPGNIGTFRFGLAANVALVVCAAALLVALVLGLIWLAVGRPTLSHIEEISPGAALDALKLSAGFVLGVGGAVALVVAYRKQRLSEEEHRRQEEASERDHTRLFNERFARASDQLGSDRPAIRLAGIYAMAGLADDWDDGRQVCIDVLCAYLRMPYSPRYPIPEYQRPEHQRPRPWEVVLGTDPDAETAAGEAQVRATVIEVLRERLWTDARVSWNGRMFDFTGAVLEDASFDGMDFTDCHVRFDDCLFIGECGFSEATFRRSDVSFLGALFAGRVGFEYSTFEESNITLYGDFTGQTDANFQGCVVKSGTLRILGPRANGGSISFVEAQLEGGDLEMHASTLHEHASIAFSRSVISGTAVKIVGGEHKAGNIWCNGVHITGGSFNFGADRWAREPLKLQGTEFSLDEWRVAGGAIVIHNVLIDGSDVHFDDLEMSDGLLDLSSCELASGSLRFSEPRIVGGEFAISGPTSPRSMRDVAAHFAAAGGRVIDSDTEVSTS